LAPKVEGNSKSDISDFAFESGWRNGNDQRIDNARPNFLVWQPENPPVIGSACLAADFNAADLRRRFSRVRKNG